MARNPKCKYCELEVEDKENAIKHGSKWYHNKCYEAWRLESEHRKELIEYICELYKLDSPTGMMLKQIKEFHEEYHYKYKGMELALRYFHSTLDNSVLEDSGIGIIPFVYEDAKKDYIMKRQVEESNKALNGIYVKEKVIRVKSPKLEFKRKLQDIDISSL